MTPKFDNGVVQFYQGDARSVLRELPAESVHSVVTSPPYWGLRDYGLAPLVWGGDDGHEHEWNEESYQRRSNDGGDAKRKQETNAGALRRDDPVRHAFCPCGTWRGSLGLEPTIDLYVDHIVEIFREVRRVLRKDGTLWLNMGDSYSNDGKWGGSTGGKHANGLHGETGIGRQRSTSGLKPKDLCMMPARVALALQADGWWLREDIVWSKPNPMPESVTDRPTRSHEYVFLLTKAERYYYDADAIRESDSGSAHDRHRKERSQTGQKSWPTQQRNGMRSSKRPDGWDSRSGAHGSFHRDGREHGDVSQIPAGRNKRSVWEIATEPMGYEWCRGCGMVYTTVEYRRLSSGAARRCTTELDDSGDDRCGGTRWEALGNGRLVCLSCEVEYAKGAVDKMPRAARCRRCEADDAWGSHFATFPQRLVEPCVLAGTSERGVCPECGAPWERVVERALVEQTGVTPKQQGYRDHGLASDKSTIGRTKAWGLEEGLVSTTDWRPTCGCSHEETVPGIVLDPFAGSGTVAHVAQRLGRRSIGTELSAEYLVLAEKRILTQTLPMTLT